MAAFMISRGCTTVWRHLASDSACPTDAPPSACLWSVAVRQISSPKVCEVARQTELPAGPCVSVRPCPSHAPWKACSLTDAAPKADGHSHRPSTSSRGAALPLPSGPGSALGAVCSISEAEAREQASVAALSKKVCAMVVTFPGLRCDPAQIASYAAACLDATTQHAMSHTASRASAAYESRIVLESIFREARLGCPLGPPCSDATSVDLMFAAATWEAIRASHGPSPSSEASLAAWPTAVPPTAVPPFSVRSGWSRQARSQASEETRQDCVAVESRDTVLIAIVIRLIRFAKCLLSFFRTSSLK
mmetsp:Transcript_49783/g.113081  ORF Transcript_49783/g.113081 Transcript_49783/m.113081 type:complete len:305 (-) Transcript_49783:96-1010(-)